MLEVRDATLSDAEQILKIYDYYVKNTAISFEYDTPSLKEFQQRMDDIMQDSLWENQPPVRRYQETKYQIRPITESDDAQIAKIIRNNLEAYHLDIPGTAYFDPELDHLSKYYAEQPEKRAYLILTDGNQVLGGVGIAEFPGFADCAEIQKLYLSDRVKGNGLGKRLMQEAEETARAMQYHCLYLETHSALKAAIGLYEKLGFQRIEKPAAVLHSTMDRFYLKRL